MSLRIEDYSVNTTEISPKNTKKLKLINNKNINVIDKNIQKGIYHEIKSNILLLL